MIKANNNDAITYTRVSSDEQRQKGYSIDYQQKETQEYCKIKNFNIIRRFSESYTAKKPGRPAFNEMLKFAKKKGIKNLVFLKSDRASRNPVDSAQLSYMAEYEGFNIHLIQDNLILSPKSKPQDFLIFEINNCFSNLYPRNLSKEVSSKMLEKAEQGYYPSKAMCGYKTLYINKRAYLKIDPEKAPFIKEIFERYATGQYSYKLLAAEMRLKNFMVSKCVKCSKNNIEDILNNPIYMGDFIWKGKRYKGKHDPIVSPELYYQCQRIIKQRSTGTIKTRNFLYTGMIRCAKCGCQFVGEIKKNKYIYYHCTGNRGGDCSKKYLKQEYIDDVVVDFLKSLTIPDKHMPEIKSCIKYQINEERAFNKEQYEAAKIKYDKLKTRADSLFNIYLDGDIDKSTYQEKKREIDYELEYLASVMHNANLKDNKVIETSERLLELFKTAYIEYLSGDFELKKYLLNLLCSNFLYDGEKLTIIIKEAFRPLVDIASFVNGGEKDAKLELLCKNFISKLTSESVLYIDFLLDEYKNLKAA